MADGSERIDPKSNSTGNVNYNLVGVGRGTGSVVNKGGERGLQGGPQEQYKMKAVGTGRYDVSDKSISSGRKM